MVFLSIKADEKLLCQADLDKAVDVLNNCYSNVLGYGLVKPYFKPGACPIERNDYGDKYWSLDYALAVDGAKFLDFSVAEDFVENISAVQEENGRVRLYGPDDFSAFPNVKEEIGSLPKFLETLYDIAVESGKRETARKAYAIIEKNLDWWYRERQDQKTGLITAVFEETFVPNTVSGSMVYAPLDTNAEIYLGSINASKLAKFLGDDAKREYYEKKAHEILSAVETYCWDDADGFYYPYVLPRKERYKIKSVNGFLGLYVGNKERNEKLVRMLLDDSEFGWDTIPLTTVSKKDPLFTVHDGDYKGNCCWLGSVWTLTNYAVIKALESQGYTELSKKLSYKTLKAFQANYAEFLSPVNGKGNGMQKYAWTAAQFLRIYLEQVKDVKIIDGKTVMNEK